jgi:hypothetical protein
VFPGDKNAINITIIKNRQCLKHFLDSGVIFITPTVGIVLGPGEGCPFLSKFEILKKITYVRLYRVSKGRVIFEYDLAHSELYSLLRNVRNGKDVSKWTYTLRTPFVIVYSENEFEI